MLLCQLRIQLSLSSPSPSESIRRCECTASADDARIHNVDGCKSVAALIATFSVPSVLVVASSFVAAMLLTGVLRHSMQAAIAESTTTPLTILHPRLAATSAMHSIDRPRKDEINPTRILSDSASVREACALNAQLFTANRAECGLRRGLFPSRRLECLLLGLHCAGPLVVAAAAGSSSLL